MGDAATIEACACGCPLEGLGWTTRAPHIDYQLSEDDADGYSRLSLLVNRELGALDEAQVLDVFLDALGAAAPASRLMERMLRSSGSLRVERARPALSPAGKVLHLRLARREARAGALGLVDATS